MAAESVLPGETGPCHGVRFYESGDALARCVADFLCEGLANAEPALVVASASHRVAIAGELRKRGYDPDTLQQARRLALVDAASLLAHFSSPQAEIDPAKFATVVGQIVDGLRQADGRQHIRVYGEMVDLLCQADRVDAALQLEVLWNDNLRRLNASLLCGYAAATFYVVPHIGHICDQHTHILPAESLLRPALAAIPA
jgi:hypothetical protein